MDIILVLANYIPPDKQLKERSLTEGFCIGAAKYWTDFRQEIREIQNKAGWLTTLLLLSLQTKTILSFPGGKQPLRHFGAMKNKM